MPPTARITPQRQRGRSGGPALPYKKKIRTLNCWTLANCSWVGARPPGPWFTVPVVGGQGGAFARARLSAQRARPHGSVTEQNAPYANSWKRSPVIAVTCGFRVSRARARRVAGVQAPGARSISRTPVSLGVGFAVYVSHVCSGLPVTKESFNFGNEPDDFLNQLLIVSARRTCPGPARH
jgi:hypothetical protein